MNNKYLRSVLAMATLAAALVTSGCASTTHRRSVGGYFDDTGTTARVKTALLRDPIVRGTAVNVDVFRGNATLSGFVASEEQKQRAEEIARTTAGVEWVKNNLAVKAELPTQEQAVGRPAGEAEVETGRAQRGQPMREGAEEDWKRGIGEEPAQPAREEQLERIERQPDAARRDQRDQLQVTEPAERPDIQPIARNIQIDASNGIATVQGSVRSEAEKQEIEQKLLQVPGIQRVDNQLRVLDQE